MAKVCTRITEWIEEKVSKPIERWVERTERKCKKRKWYDPRRWLCWLVTTLVKVIRWIVVTVVTAVVKIVCHFITDLLSIIWNLIRFIALLFLSLFRWSKCTLLEAIGALANALIGVLTLIGDVIIRPIVDRVQTYRLRKWVKREIAQTYWQQPDIIPLLNEKFSVDHGVFGFRNTCTVYTMYVDSQTKVPERFGDVPNLYALHQDGRIDLFKLVGFDRDCRLTKKSRWYHPRHQAAKSPFALDGGTVQQKPPELSREELQEYIDSEGTKGPHFRIYAVSPSNLDTKTDAAEEKGRQVGLRFDFKHEYKEVIDPQFINYNKSPINPVEVDCATKNKGQTDYLICELRRRSKSDFECCHYRQENQVIGGSLGEARTDLCSPIAVAIFGFTDKTTRGLTNNLIGTRYCEEGRNLSASITSGVSFIDDIPDEIRKYVLIHELGHYFGLCHVDGFDRIMVSGKEGQGDLFTWKTIPNSFIHGGPRFIYAEAQRVWRFILTNFPLSCLLGAVGIPPVVT